MSFWWHLDQNSQEETNLAILPSLRVAVLVTHLVLRKLVVCIETSTVSETFGLATMIFFLYQLTVVFLHVALLELFHVNRLNLIERLIVSSTRDRLTN